MLGLSNRPKVLVDHIQELPIGPFGALPRKNHESFAVPPLEAVLEHRSIDLLEQIVPNLDHIIWPDTKDLGVVRRVVNLAQRQSVPNRCDAAFMPIRDDMRSVQ